MPTYLAAWETGKTAVEPKAKALADRAAGEYAKMLARLGRFQEIKEFLEDLGERPFIGQSTELIAGTRQGMALMEQRPEIAFRCGPLALESILRASGKISDAPNIQDTPSTINGISLFELAAISRKAGLNFQVARRSANAPFTTPCVVHWNVGHYAALISKEGDKYQAADPTFGNEAWISEEALKSESSGYFLVPAGTLPEGWTAIPEEEAKTVFGKGATSGNNPNATTSNDAKGGGDGNPCGKGMANYSFHMMLVSLSIQDTPIGYSPPYGDPVNFTATYNQREASQPSNFNFSNLGPKWSHNWLGFITDDPSVPSVASLAVPGGGTENFSGYSAASATFAPNYKTQATLRRVSASPIRYELSQQDGSKDVFGLSDGSTFSPRRIFLTQRINPAGNVTTLTYDAQLRLATITDAVGQVTTFAYENADPFLITKVTDPFGRQAIFTYATGKLARIRDVIGIESSFAYEGATDFINALTTPYGTTTFSKSESGRTRRLTATDPQGDSEVLEFNENSALRYSSDPAELLPAGMFLRNSILYARNSYHWDKKAWKDGSEDYSKARLYHWLHTANYTQADRELESYKMPFEHRVWLNYPGQPQNNEGATVPGTLNKPSVIGRRLLDGRTELQKYAYNELGRPISEIDAVGRTTTYEYAANQIDLIAIRQLIPGTTPTSETLASFTYNSIHLPLTQTDAAGQLTTYEWNTMGQITSVKNAKNETATFIYYMADATGKQRKGRLQTINGPLPGDQDIVSFDYDTVGRTASVTGPDGYNLSYIYDALDRLTRVTYPDGTYTETIYQRLDPFTSRDRLGRLTTYAYNPLRQLISVTDPANRTIQYRWCKCGDLAQLIDAMGRLTRWRHDVQGRLTAKIYNDASQITYSYQEDNGLRRSITDEKGQIKTLSYNLDHTLAGIAYTNEEHETPDVSFTYETPYRRLLTMLDGIGTTTYGYHPVTPGTLGAGQLSTVDGPWANDIISYGYDSLGRILTRAIDGVAETATFDPAGRLSTVTNALGAFTYLYDGATSRLTSATHSGGVKSVFSYFPNNQDRRLQKISNLNPDGVTPLSVFDYTYDAHGRIRTWKQQQDNASASAQLWTLGYDDADQLTSNVVTQGAATVSTSAWAYDKAGNRTSETINGVPTIATHNARNELISTSATLPIATYEWDAENRLISINQGANRSEFGYDGKGRRIRIVEKAGGNLISSQNYIWNGLQICERRDGGVVRERYFKQGFQSNAGGSPDTNLYTKDHLGSIREVTATSGILRGRLAYDAWGKTGSLPSPAFTSFAYTGHFLHTPSGFALAPFRAYNPMTARWLSADPIGETGGINLYAYCYGNPLNLYDPDGRDPRIIGGAVLGAIYGGFSARRWGQPIWRGAISGAVGGAVFALTFNPAAGASAAALVGGGMLAGGSSGLMSGVTGEIFDAFDPCKGFNPGDVLEETAYGVVTGGFNKYTGTFLSRYGAPELKTKGMKILLDQVGNGFEAGVTDFADDRNILEWGRGDEIMPRGNSGLDWDPTD
jgi:RHS repeat-associated protein